jgi:hypothetical protein
MTKDKHNRTKEYTSPQEERIMIRAMPCPECFAKPREFCTKYPNEKGEIGNHRSRKYLFQAFVDSAESTGSVDLYGCKSYFVTKAAKEEHDKYNVV